MSKIKVSDLEEATVEPNNEPKESNPTKPKRVRPKKPVKEIEPPIIAPPPEPIIEDPEPIQVDIHKPAKKIRGMVTRGNCGKELLEKTFKYYHQLKCKRSSDEQDTHRTKSIEPSYQFQEHRPENNTVDFNYRRSTMMRRDRYASLISRAF